MNPWLIASIAMLLAMLLPTWTALRGSIGHRLVAVEMVALVSTLLLVSLSLAFGQPSFLDLALALALLSLPGTLVMTTFLERWI